MHTQNRLAATAAVLLAAGLSVPAAHAQWPARAVHVPDAALVARLNAPQRFGPFTLRTPRGYKLTTKVVPARLGQLTEYAMQTPLRKDGTQSVYLLLVAVGRPGNTRVSANTLLDSDVVLLHEPDLVLTPREKVVINGLPVLYRRFHYHFRKGDAIWQQGFQYATTDGHTSAVLMALSQPPDAAADLALLQTATLTLRKAK